MKMQLDTLPFHQQIMTDAKGYYYELRYWENRFDQRQLGIFMTCMEVILEAMLDEPSVRRLKKHLPEHIFPKHYFIEAESVNREAGCELISGVSGDTKVKAYVLDENCRKQPYGGWGNLYIMDHETKGWLDKITNPYGKGVLYQTGRTARILPDGSIDMMENGGRTVMSEGIAGRHFLDLYKLEETLCGYEGIRSAEAYIRYAEENRLVLTADICGSEEPDMDSLKKYLADKCEKQLIPGEIRFRRIDNQESMMK